jgi:serine/threonine protein kinase
MNPLTERDPERYGRWQLLARVAEGGMGVVYLAGRDGEVAALKAVQQQLAWDEEYRLRFRHEVEALSKVRSPFVVQLRDADPDAPTPWLVMDYEPATSLDVTVRRSGPLQRFHGLKLLSKLAQGVAALHDAGVVHRDLKPSNVLVTDDGPRIIDLGIARVDEGSATGTYGPLTEAWSSPEQLDAHPQVTAATDVFNLGLIAGFALSGVHPFGRSGSTRALAAMVVAMCAGRPAHLDVDHDIRELLLACFAAPAARPTPEELARGFTNLARGHQLDVREGDFGRGLLPWQVPDDVAIARHAAPAPATTNGSGPSAPQRVEDVNGRFIVLPASLGWNPLVGLDDEVSTALRASSVVSRRGDQELRWTWRGYEFILPLAGSLSAPGPDETLWSWLDGQVSRFDLPATRADIGGRVVHTSSPADELFVSLNPDVSPERPHFVVLETDDDPSPPPSSEMSYAGRSGRELPWDEAEEERLTAEFLGGVPIQRLAEAFGRSARELCHRLEVLGVVERIRTTDAAAALIA